MRSRVSEPFDDSAVKNAAKKQKAAPDKESVLKEFGTSGYSETPDGKWTVNLDNPEKVKRFSQMYESVRRIDKERGLEVRAKERRVRLVNRNNGKSLDIPEQFAESAAKKHGMVEKSRWKATHRWVDGEWWVRENGKWVPEG